MGSEPKKLVYYDGNGSRHSNLVSEILLSKIMQLFDGSWKAVSRSSGGLGLAMPTGIKFDVQGDGPVSSPDEIFIQLGCFEFSNESTTAEKAFTVRPKLLPISRVKECFNFASDGQQRYVADFGSGLIPVRVVRFIKTASGQEMALFLDARDAERAEKATSSVTVQPLWMPRECLRWAREPAGYELPQDESQLAEQQYQKLIDAGKRIFPRVLRMGGRISFTPQSQTLIDLGKILNKVYQQTQGRTHVRNHTMELGPEGLLPLGIFEGTESVIKVD